MVAVAGHRLGNRCLWPFSAGAQGLFSSSAAPVVEMATQEDLATPPLVPLIDRASREVKSTQILAQMQIPERRSRRRAATADEDSIERASRRVA